MKKSAKLLSILLAILMIFSSVSVLAAAAPTQYKTSADLENLQAYDPYGRVTRFETDERISIFFDFLDQTLGKANINLGEVVNVNLGVAHIKIMLDLRSIDRICASLDTIANTVNGYQGLIGGDVNKLWFTEEVWQRGMQRGNVATQGKILFELVKLLNKNAVPLGNILRAGKINLGLIGSFVPIDLNSVLSGLPSMIKGFIFPLLERWDDDEARINLLKDTNGSVEKVIQDYVNGMLTKNVSIATYKEDAAGKCISAHHLPGAPAKGTVGTRHYFVKGGTGASSYFTRYFYDETKGIYVPEKEVYERVQETENVFHYTRKATNENLVWYVDGTPALHSMHTVDANGVPHLKKGITTENFNLKTKSGADLLYFFLPYIFRDMAPIAANGSLKKEMAQFFGAKFNVVGDKNSAELQNEIKGLNLNGSDFFTKDQETYIWDYSDYAVFTDAEGNPVHFWRWQDQYWKADLSGTNPFFDIIDWNYRISPDFIDEFMPNADGTAKAGQPAYRTHIFSSLNDLVYKVVQLVMNDKAMIPGTQTPLKSLWEKGDNSKLVDNAQKLAQAVIKVSPESIFGTNYDRPERYYNLIMTEGTTAKDRQQILVGVACTLIDLFAPQIVLPRGDELAKQNVDLGAILAALVRELATQLVPNKDYDALIYKDYATKTFLPGKDNMYWLDVIFTIGTDIGYKYVASVVDLGEDKATFSGAHWDMKDKVYTPADLTVKEGAKTFKLWEARLDYIFDLGLTKDIDFGFHFEKFFNIGNATVDLKTVQDPLQKAENAVNAIIANSEIVHLLNIDTSKTGWLRTMLFDKLILAAFNLDFTVLFGAANATGTFNVPKNSPLRKADILTQVVVVARDLVNGILRNVLDNKGSTADDPNLLSTSLVTGVDNIFTLQTIGTLVESVLDKTYHAYNNGALDPVLPLLNMFVGWKSIGQQFQNPFVSIKDSATGGRTLAADANKKISADVVVINDIGGMLLKHKTADGKTEIDKNYVITIEDITTNDPSLGLSVTKADGSAFTKGQKIGPWEKAEFKVTGTFKREAPVTVTVKYSVTGRDGKQIGSSKELNFYTYTTAVKTPMTTAANAQHKDAGFWLDKRWLIGVAPQAAPQFYVVHDFADVPALLTNLRYPFENSSQYTDADKADNENIVWVTGAKTQGAVPAFAKLDVAVRTNKYARPADSERGEGIFSRTAGKDVNDKCSLHVFSFNRDADLSSFENAKGPKMYQLPKFDIEFSNTSIVKTSSGKFFMTGGKNTITTSGIDGGKIVVLDDARLIQAFDKASQLRRDQFVAGAAADAAWTQFQNAMKEASDVVFAPFTEMRYKQGKYNTANVDKLVKGIDDAVAALVKAGHFDAGSTTLQNALNKAETGASEINYQDYDLYEYFKYQGNRNDIRWRINAYTKPAASLPDYIPSNPWLAKDIIDKAVAAENNSQTATAITQSLAKRTEAEQAAQAEKASTWQVPSFTDMENDDLAAKLLYTQRHLQKVKADFHFLEREIALADAFLAKATATDYSKSTWEAFNSSLTKAKAVLADKASLPHVVFDAKYALMKSYNELIPADMSCQDAGYYANLNSLIAQADAIFANPNLYDVKSGASATAWGDLITALGYTDAEGTQFYPNSAKAFVATDRFYSKNEGARIDAQVQNLKTALANFECKVKLAPMENTTTQVSSDGSYIINGINPATILNEAAFDKYVKTVAPAGVAVDRVLTPALDGYFGTGTTAALKMNDNTLATYTLVIYGDVNGDGAVDAFDAALLDRAIVDSSVLNGTTALAGDVVGADGKFTAEDYAAITTAAKGGAAINQVR